MQLLYPIDSNAPPWADSHEWRELHTSLQFWLQRRRDRLRKAAATATMLQAVLSDLDAMMAVLSEATCPECEHPCCRVARVWFDFRDAVYLHLTDLPLPLSQIRRSREAPCPHLAASGCRIPRPARPFICTWYLCGAQREVLGRSPAPFQARLADRLVLAGSLRKEMAARFVDALC